MSQIDQAIVISTSEPVSKNFNKFFQIVVFPNEFKIAQIEIVPVYKSDIHNYRPISILSEVI